MFSALLLTVRSGVGQISNEDINKLPSRPPTAKMAYGSAPQQFAELRLPEGRGRFPVVAILHGGCWIGYAGVEYTAHLATALTDAGFATWNVEYRRGHEAGGGWPGTFEDAERGVNALRDAAAKYALDMRRVVLLGHSAGGQLALYVGSRLKWPAISLAGIVDMRAYARGGPKHCVEGEYQVMGGTPEEHPDRYAKVSPAELLPLGIAQVLIWGERDNIVPESLFADYERRADRAEIVRVPGAGHHEFGAAEGAAWKAILAAVLRLTNTQTP
ncbi:MAG: alpha/beta hydrolase [Acidobacteriaceae bacterium]|nr:alpha/beta hydrolase [Acidobacteriaceae bacterium]